VVAVVVALLLVAGVVAVAVRGDTTSSSAPGASLAAALRAATPASSPFTDLTELRARLGGRCLHMVVADSDAERVAGLRGRSDLGSYDAMLFVFERPERARFTMSGVPVDLEIGFYDARGHPAGHRHMTPCPHAETECPTYGVDSELLYAVETLGGRLPAGSLARCPG
jgi:uncharacterized membrane protein (UPF0127 family)